MKDKLTLGPKGVRALVVLCAHVIQHGTFAADGKDIAYALIAAAGARDDVRSWLSYDGHDPKAYEKHQAAKRQRLADAIEALRDSTKETP